MEPSQSKIKTLYQVMMDENGHWCVVRVKSGLLEVVSGTHNEQKYAIEHMETIIFQERKGHERSYYAF